MDRVNDEKDIGGGMLDVSDKAICLAWIVVAVALLVYLAI